jgi:hypothetical protein
MNYSVFSVLLLGSVICLALAMAGTKSPIACEILSEKDALALVGGPLGELFKTEEAPSKENGYDHISVCGFFPKGYNIQKADRPPERGLQLQLHSMRNATDAKNLYNNSLSTAEVMSKMPGNPYSGAAITPLKGMGQAAFMQVTKIEPGPSSSYQIAIVTFLKGNVMGQLTTWKKATPVEEIAKSAAKQVISRLP